MAEEHRHADDDAPRKPRMDDAEELVRRYVEQHGEVVNVLVTNRTGRREVPEFRPHDCAICRDAVAFLRARDALPENTIDG